MHIYTHCYTSGGGEEGVVEWKALPRKQHSM